MRDLDENNHLLHSHNSLRDYHFDYGGAMSVWIRKVSPRIEKELAELRSQLACEKKFSQSMEWSTRALRRKLVVAVDLIREIIDMKYLDSIEDVSHAADQLVLKSEKFIKLEIIDVTKSYGDGGRYEKLESKCAELEALIEKKDYFIKSYIESKCPQPLMNGLIEALSLKPT